MKVRLPKLESGRCRSFIACAKCGRATYYDYVPYSLSAPIACLPCGHGITEHVSRSTRPITEEQFRAYWADRPEGHAIR